MVLLCAMLAACTTSAGTLPRVGPLPPEAGFKLLKPGASAIACEGGLFTSYGAPTDLMGRVTASLLGRDAEADSVINAQVEWSSWSIGVYARRCVRMEGDVARSVRTILLPMPGGHGGAGHE
jgi:hypothetical protein